MKFVCDRCQTRYSISDEKVRQKILRIRCKTCGNVIVVQDRAARGSGEVEHPALEGARQARAGGAKGPMADSPVEARPRSAPPPLPTRAAKAKGKSGDRLGGRVEWFVAIDGTTSGPLTRAELARRIVAAGGGKEVHVWKEGMAAWKSPNEVSVIVRELNTLRPARPPALPAPPTAPVGQPTFGDRPAGLARGAADRHTVPSTIPRSLEGAAREEVSAAKVDDLFGDVTTQKMEGMSELAAASEEAGFNEDEATTKKGKDLRGVERESLFESSPTVIDSQETPPPMEPLPPVGGKAAAGAAAAPSIAVAPRPAPTFTPPPALSRTPIPSLAVPVLPPHATASHLGVPAAGRAVPPFVAPTLPPHASARATPLSPLAIPGTPIPPQAAGPMSGPPSLLPARGSLPTPQPVMPLGPDVAPVVSLEYPVASSAPTGLLQRRPGLKYVVAALAIVALIILLGLVILRSTREKLDTPVPVGAIEPAGAKPVPAEPAPTEPIPSEPAPSEPAASEPAGSGPAKVEPLKAEPKAPVLAVAESPRPSPPVAERPAPRRGGRRYGRTQVSEPERPPKEKPEPKPPRLAGARPNPFDEVKGVTQGQIMAVVRNPANQSALKSCYERALKMDNHLTSGRMDITVSIRSSGAVERVVVNGPSSFVLVEPCIKGVVKRWRFPSNTEDYGTSFPLILQGGM